VQADAAGIIASNARYNGVDWFLPHIIDQLLQ